MPDNNTLQAQLLQRAESIGPQKPPVNGDYGIPVGTFEGQQPSPIGMAVSAMGDPLQNVGLKPGGVLGNMLGKPAQAFESEPDMRLVKYLLNMGANTIGGGLNKAWRGYTGHNLFPNLPAYLEQKLTNR